MYLYTFVDQSGGLRLGKLPFNVSVADAKAVLPLMVSGESCTLYGTENMTVMDTTKLSVGIEYSCVMVTLTDQEGGRISIPFLDETSADEGAKIKDFSDALMGKTLFDQGTPIVSVTGTVVGTFTA